MARHFPDWLEAYRDYAKHGEAPDIFHYWTGAAVVAGALRRKVWIHMGYFTWYPNMFIFFVAPPGIVAKSTTADIGMRLLAELPFIHVGPAATSWQALVQKMSEIQEDYTLPDGAFMPMSAITIVASELGTFIDPTDRGMIDALVSLWDGKDGPWSKLTKKDGEETIINPWIHILGCTTPAWIAENLTEYFSGGGFASRTVFVYADKKAKLVAYPFRHMPKDSSNIERKLIEDLDHISSLVGAFKITEDALDWGEANYEEHYTVGVQHLQNDRFGGYLARKQGHIHKLAMVISASQADDLIITKSQLQEAYAQVSRLEADMPKVYGSAQREKSAVLASEILSYIKANGTVGKEELFRKYFKIMSHDTFEVVVESMVKGGYVGHDNVEGTVMLTYRLKDKK